MSYVELHAHSYFSLLDGVSSPEALRLRDDLAFFQAVAGHIRGSRDDDSEGGTDVELETAVRQVVSDAVTATGVVDIYAAAGIDRPDISIIDDDAQVACLGPVWKWHGDQPGIGVRLVPLDAQGVIVQDEALEAV